jgi:glutathione S-transferase
MHTFFYSTQTCSTAVHIALEEAGLPFKGIEVSWKRKVNVAELEAVNPLGQVPVLVKDGQALNQSISILEFVGDQNPAKKLFPAVGTWERSQALGWLSFIGADFQKSFLAMFMASRWTTNTAVQVEIKNSVIAGIEKHLVYIDQALAGKDFILGKQFSVVDAYLFTIVGWCKWSEIKIGKYSNLVAYMKRVYDRPAVQKVLAKEEMLDFIPS